MKLPLSIQLHWPYLAANKKKVAPFHPLVRGGVLVRGPDKHKIDGMK